MRVFHGTSAQHLGDILQRGIQPRGEAVGNWPDLPSAPDHVYLTTAYPLWYAYSSIDATAYAMDMALLLEVETDGLGEGKFYPDEDFLCQYPYYCALKGTGDPKNWSLEPTRMRRH